MRRLIMSRLIWIFTVCNGGIVQQLQDQMFFHLFTKENNFYDFLFAFMDGDALPNWALLLRERICPLGEQLTDQEISECKAAFGLYDRDGDGYVTTVDLGSVLRSMGIFPTDNELMDILNEADPDGEGEIDFPQFLEIVFKKSREYKHEEEMRLAFSTYDKEGNGRISMPDFEYIITSLYSNLTDQEINDIKKDADRKGLGYVSYDDFVTMMTFR